MYHADLNSQFSYNYFSANRLSDVIFSMNQLSYTRKSLPYCQVGDLPFSTESLSPVGTICTDYRPRLATLHKPHGVKTIESNEKVNYMENLVIFSWD